MGPLSPAISETEGDEPPESDNVPAAMLSQLTGKEVSEYSYEKKSASEEDARSSQVLEPSACQAESSHLTLVAGNMDTCTEPSSMVTSIVSGTSACQAETSQPAFCTSVCQTELSYSTSVVGNMVICTKPLSVATIIPHNSACQAESSHPILVAGSMDTCAEPSSVATNISHISPSDIGRGTNSSQMVHPASAGLPMTTKDGTLFQTTSAGEDLDLEKGLFQLLQQSEQASHDGTEQGRVSKLDRNESTGEHVCRVCYLGLAAQCENGPPIELGCECKHDLAFAHRQCAETWFKIKGNRTCEICGSTVLNINGIDDPNFLESWNDGNARATPATDEIRCWQNHRLFNVLLACMVFAFVLPWLFHVTAFFT